MNEVTKNFQYFLLDTQIKYQKRQLENMANEEAEDAKSQKLDLPIEEYEKLSMYKKSGVVFEQYKEEDGEELAMILEEEYLEDKEDNEEGLTSL